MGLSTGSSCNCQLQLLSNKNHFMFVYQDWHKGSAWDVSVFTTYERKGQVLHGSNPLVPNRKGLLGLCPVPCSLLFPLPVFCWIWCFLDPAWSWIFLLTQMKINLPHQKRCSLVWFWFLVCLFWFGLVLAELPQSWLSTGSKEFRAEVRQGAGPLPSELLSQLFVPTLGS